MLSRRTWILLLLIWFAFLIRGTFYSALIPLWEGWDEYSHVDFIQYLSLGNGLPPPDHHISAEISQAMKLAPAPLTLNYLSLTSHDDFWQLPESERMRRAEALKQLPQDLQRQPGRERMLESKQPPLYYWLAATVLQPFHNRSLVDRVFLGRLLSIFIASSLVFLSFFAARQVFGDAETALRVSALITAVPELFISVARVSNEPVAILLFSLLACSLILVGKGHNSAIFAAELTLGLGFLSKAYFVAAVPAVAVAALVVIVRSNSAARVRVALQITAAGTLSLALCSWWYLRSLGSGGGPIWEDAAPVTGGVSGGFLQSLLAMEWYRAVDFTLYSHVWLGGWSFLSVRSWIYHFFMYGIVAGLAVTAYFLLRHRRPRAVEATTLGLLALLYAGFWASLLYHAFVSFSRVQHPASGGYYLYAAVIPETLLVIFGLLQFTAARWRNAVLAAITTAVVGLDIYTSHFVALPYYTGIIRHSANGSLPAFHPDDAAALGFQELLSRLLINRPAVLGPGLLLCLWAASVILTISLPLLAGLHRRTT